MSENVEQDRMVEEIWRSYLTTGESPEERRHRRLFKLLPGDPRCKICYAPFRGLGGNVARMLYGKGPSSLNPNLCNVCETFAREHQGGAEIELSLLFADVRGSTTLAESMDPRTYGRIINRFYNVVSQVMIDSNALIDKIIGDQVAGMYVPGFAGQTHARRAILAAQQVMAATGHGEVKEPWIPLGAGVHTGTAFVGSMGSRDGVYDITVLGDAANTAARLSSAARIGEILVSAAAAAAAGLQGQNLEGRTLELKGKRESTSVFVLDEYSPDQRFFSSG